MSRDTKYMISVMQAYEDGKAIEHKPKDGETWMRCQFTPMWNWVAFEYRIKPEPKYVPYDSVSEIEKDKWLKGKLTGRLFRIIGLDNPSNNFVRLEYGWESLKELFEKYTYEDGTPCGKKVEA